MNEKWSGRQSEFSKQHQIASTKQLEFKCHPRQLEHPSVDLSMRSSKRNLPDVNLNSTTLNTITESNELHQNHNSRHNVQHTNYVGIKNWQYQLTCNKL